MNGVIVPLITPLRPNESLDETGLERLVEHVISGGVSGLFVLGSSGEGPALPLPIKERLVRAVSQQAKGRVLVLVGTFGVGTTRTIEEATQLTRHGGDAIVVTAPYYFAHSQEEIAAHITAVAQSQSVPTIIYNIPQMVKTVIEPQTLGQLAQVPQIIGVKDSYGDMVRFQETLKLQSERFSVFQGAEGVAALSIACGARGAVLGLANVAPKLCCDLLRAARSADLSPAWELQERLMILWKLHTHGQWLPCLKAAVSLLGICGPTPAAPFRLLDKDAIAAIRHDLEAAKVLSENHL